MVGYYVMDEHFLQLEYMQVHFRLFLVIGGTYGGGAGDSTLNMQFYFCVPDFRGSFLSGAGRNGTHSTFNGEDITGFPEQDSIKTHHHQYTRSYYNLSFNAMRVVRSITNYFLLNHLIYVFII